MNDKEIMNLVRTLVQAEAAETRGEYHLAAALYGDACNLASDAASMFNRASLRCAGIASDAAVKAAVKKAVKERDAQAAPTPFPPPPPVVSHDIDARDGDPTEADEPFVPFRSPTGNLPPDKIYSVGGKPDTVIKMSPLLDIIGGA